MNVAFLIILTVFIILLGLECPPILGMALFPVILLIINLMSK